MMDFSDTFKNSGNVKSKLALRPDKENIENGLHSPNNLTARQPLKFVKLSESFAPLRETNACKISKERIDLENWIHNQLKEFSLDSIKIHKSTDESVLQCIQFLLVEKERYHDQMQFMTNQLNQLKNESNVSLKDMDKHEEAIATLKHELTGANAKLSAVLIESKEHRNQWLNEKNELTSKCIQAQALQTQLQGTLKKKEKEFEKLQTQLEKVVKDGNRGNKLVMMISKPIPKNLSQQQLKPNTLKDAELQALYFTLQNIELENEKLRQHVTQLQQSLIESNSLHERNLNHLQAKYETTQFYLMQENQSLHQGLVESEKLDLKIQEESKSLTQVEELKEKLLAAEALIDQQDSLIREALFGKLENYDLISAALSTSSKPLINPPSSRDLVSMMASSPRVSRSIENLEFNVSASPATITLLRNCGWSENDLPKAE